MKKKTFAARMRKVADSASAVKPQDGPKNTLEAVYAEGWKKAETTINDIIVEIEKAASKGETCYYYLAGHKCNTSVDITLARAEVEHLTKMLKTEGFNVESADYENVPDRMVYDETWVNIAIRVKW